MMKRFASLLLAALMLASALALPACSGSETEENNPTTTAATAATTAPDTAPTHDANGYLLDNLPADLNYDDATFTILHWNDASNTEFLVEESTGNLIDDSVYNRNRRVEERLGIKLNFLGIKGNNSNRNDFIATVTNSVSAGNRAYDLVAAYSMCSASLAAAGLTVDLMETEYLDFSKPWWPDRLTEESLINGSLYFASGDISTNLLWSMLLVIYNRDLLNDLGIKEDPLDMVQNGTWTLDNMFAMTKGVYADLDGDNKRSDSDRWGFTTSNVYCDALYYAAGLNITERNADGEVIISPTFGSEKTQTLITKLLTFFGSEDGRFYTNSVYSPANYFASGNSLFELRPTTYIKSNVVDSSVTFGVLPTPKYDEQQLDYITTAGFTYTLYCIPIDAGDMDMSSAVLECLGAEAYRTTTPAIFETALKVKYAVDEKSAQVFDTIRDGLSFDLGRIFCLNFNSGTKYATYNLFRYTLVNNTTDWMSTYAAEEAILEHDLAALLAAFD